jgi:hypothetical protein
LKELKAENDLLKKDMSQYEKCDPARLEEMKSDTKICKEACDRWVDNIFIVQDFIKKSNPSVTNEDLEKNFPILKDLDNVVFVSKE